MKPAKAKAKPNFPQASFQQVIAVSVCAVDETCLSGGANSEIPSRLPARMPGRLALEMAIPILEIGGIVELRHNTALAMGQPNFRRTPGIGHINLVDVAIPAGNRGSSV
ncbi:MAG: hypothetical protein ACRD4C_11605 [Candidatus Acidiferrales bacterium]